MSAGAALTPALRKKEEKERSLLAFAREHLSRLPASMLDGLPIYWLLYLYVRYTLNMRTSDGGTMPGRETRSPLLAEAEIDTSSGSATRLEPRLCDLDEADYPAIIALWERSGLHIQPGGRDSA